MSILRCWLCDAAVDTDFDTSGHTNDAGDYTCAACIEDALNLDTDADTNWPEGEDERLDDPRHNQAADSNKVTK